MALNYNDSHTFWTLPHEAIPTLKIIDYLRIAIKMSRLRDVNVMSTDDNIIRQRRKI